MTRLRERPGNAAARGADPMGAGGRGARYALSLACPKAMAMATDVTPEQDDMDGIVSSCAGQALKKADRAEGWRGRVRTRASLIGVLLWASSSFAASAGSTSPDGSWELSVGGQVGVPRGYVQVRENQIRGTRLQLHHVQWAYATGRHES